MSTVCKEVGSQHMLQSCSLISLDKVSWFPLSDVGANDVGKPRGNASMKCCRCIRILLIDNLRIMSQPETECGNQSEFYSYMCLKINAF